MSYPSLDLYLLPKIIHKRKVRNNNCRNGSCGGAAAGCQNGVVDECGCSAFGSVVFDDKRPQYYMNIYITIKATQVCTS